MLSELAKEILIDLFWGRLTHYQFGMMTALTELRDRGLITQDCTQITPLGRQTVAVWRSLNAGLW